MRKEYEEIVLDICKIDSVRKASQPEREGSIGVACMLSFIKGTEPTIDSMSKDIGVPAHEVEVPFRRLVVNGLFSAKYNAKEDPVLLGSDKVCTDGYTGFTGLEMTRNAWAIIAGVSSGLTGLREK